MSVVDEIISDYEKWISIWQKFDEYRLQKKLWYKYDIFPPFTQGEQSLSHNKE